MTSHNSRCTRRTRVLPTSPSVPRRPAPNFLRHAPASKVPRRLIRCSRAFAGERDGRYPIVAPSSGGSASKTKAPRRLLKLEVSRAFPRVSTSPDRDRARGGGDCRRAASEGPSVPTAPPPSKSPTATPSSGSAASGSDLTRPLSQESPRCPPLHNLSLHPPNAAPALPDRPFRSGRTP